MSLVGIIGLLVGLAVLIILTYKGMHVIPVSLIASLIVILSNNVDIWGVLSGDYAVSMKNFVGNYLIMFFLGSLLGELLSLSGAARSIAYKLADVFGAKRSILIVVLASAILSYGGVSVFVIVFSVYPLTLFLFSEADIPKKLIPATILLGAGTFTMTALPGSPSLPNIIPTTFLGTTPTAAPVIGVITAIIMFIAGYLYLMSRVKKYKEMGLHFVPGKNDRVEKLSDEEITKLPHWGIALLPILSIFVVIFALKGKVDSVFAVCIALFAGVTLGYILFWKKIDGKLEITNKSASGSIGALLNTASIVGFGGTVRAVPAFQRFVNFALGLSFNPIISAVLAVNVIAGITGSSSGGITIFMEAMAQHYLAMGINPQVFHRISTIASGVLDSLPHAGPNVTFLAVTNLTYKEAYPHMFFITCVVPFIGTVTAILLSLVGLV